MPTYFTLVFLVFLALTTLTRLWLARRHIACVQAHRAAVPEQFAERITLGAHQKAADYTSAKTHLGMQACVAEALLLLALTPVSYTHLAVYKRQGYLLLRQHFHHPLDHEETPARRSLLTVPPLLHWQTEDC